MHNLLSIIGVTHSHAAKEPKNGRDLSLPPHQRQLTAEEYDIAEQYSNMLREFEKATSTSQVNEIKAKFEKIFDGYQTDGAPNHQKMYAKLARDRIEKHAEHRRTYIKEMIK